MTGSTRIVNWVVPALVIGTVSIAGCKAGPPPRSKDRPQILAIENVVVVPMDRERLLPSHTVLIRGSTIAQVAPTDSVDIPAEAIRIEGRGRYLLPGLADMHVHLYDTQGLVSYLSYGVTTVANLNGSPDVLVWQRQTRENSRPGPTIYTTGPSVNGYPGGNPLFVVAATPEDARSIVRDQKDAGYNFVKVYSFLEEAVYTALVDEAKRLEMPVLGHIPFSVGLQGVLASGQVNIAHVEEFFQTGDIEDSRIDSVAAAVGAAGVTVTANLCAYADYLRSIEDLPGMLHHREMRFASPAAFSEKLPSNNRSVRPNPTDFARFLSTRLERFRILTRALERAGIPLLVGTDTEIFGFAGHSTHEELAELVRAGLSPYQALRCATATAGEFIGHLGIETDSFGTVTSGQRADLLLVDRNPIEDISNAASVQGVVVRGRWYSKLDLDRMRDSVAVAEGDTKQQIARIDSLVGAGNAVGAAAVLRQVRTEHPGITPVAEIVLYNYARRVFERDRKGSIELRQLAVELYPHSFSAQNQLANGYLSSGDTTQAMIHYKAARALSPWHFVIRDALEKLEAGRTPPSFEAAGRYVFEPVTMRLAKGPAPVTLTLEVTGPRGHYRGRILYGNGDAVPVEDLVIGGSSIWAGIPFDNGYLELRLKASADSVAGTWVLGIMNNGSIRGRRV
ncbi:MAG TPA: amidohydrolase family protein [Candidatus Krumholzibacteria bacterium]|nr:amidohydrolase family protein [Candidatus Krumholzibacteria bacterium]